MGEALNHSVAAAVAAVALSATVLIGLVVFSSMPANHDASIYLQCAQLLLEGKLPYVDYVELNPPMAHYVHVPVVAVANLFRLDVATVFQFSVLLMVGYSTWMLVGTIRTSETQRNGASHLLIAAGWLAFSVFVFADGGFGQREHLFVLTYIPFLFVRYARYRRDSVGTSTAIVAAALAGPMMLLKPHFVALVVLAELTMMMRFRRIPLSPEIAVVFVIAVAYASHFLLWPEAVRQQFFYRWIPTVAEHYGTYNKPMGHLIANVAGMWIFLGAVIVVSFFVKRVADQSQVTLIHVLMLLSVAAAALYLVQHKGWSYHRYPAIGFGMLLGSICAARLTEVVDDGRLLAGTRTKLARAYPAVIVGFLLVMLGGWTADASRVGMSRAQAIDSYVDQIEANTHDEDRVVFISTSPNPGARILIYANRQPGTRYLCAFPIAFAYDGVESTSVSGRPYRTISEWTADERLFLEEMGADIAKSRPKIVFVQSSKCLGCPSWFRITDYLRASGWQGRYMDGYVLQRRMHQFDVYVRAAGATGPVATYVR